MAFATGRGMQEQALQLVISSTLGALLYGLAYGALKAQRGSRGTAALEPVAMAIAAGMTMFSCLSIMQSHFLTSTGLSAPSTAEFYLFVGAVGGGAAVVHTHSHFDGRAFSAATIAMLAHSIAEGAGLGLLARSAGFLTVFRSQVLHGIPDGALMAVDSLGRGGLVHAMLVATAVRVCQAVAFYVTAAYAPPVSEEAQWVAEGVALGSLAIMTVEFLGPAARGLGREWVAGTILASLLASYWLDSIFHSIV